MKTNDLVKTNRFLTVRVLVGTLFSAGPGTKPARQMAAAEGSQAGKTAELYAGRYQPASSPKEVADFYILNTMGGLRR